MTSPLNALHMKASGLIRFK